MTLMVLPFLTQVMVFRIFLVEGVGVGATAEVEGVGVGAIGEFVWSCSEDR